MNIANVDAPWTEAQIGQLVWMQSADTLLVCHPEVPPRKVTRTAETSWTVTQWAFFKSNDSIKQPYHKFSGDAVTLASSGVSESVTLSASQDVFVDDHIGVRCRDIELAKLEVNIRKKLDFQRRKVLLIVIDGQVPHCG